MKNYFNRTPSRFNLEPLLKYFQMSFVYESPYAVGPYVTVAYSGCCQIESVASSAPLPKKILYLVSKICIISGQFLVWIYKDTI